MTLDDVFFPLLATKTPLQAIFTSDKELAPIKPNNWQNEGF